MGRWATVVGLAVAVLATWPTSAGAESLPATESGAPCTDQAVGSCLLPYPSDRWLVPDASTATGVRVQVPGDVLPEKVLGQFGPGGTVADAFDGADGFSALTPIFFELPEAVDPATLPADGGDAFLVYDATTGTRAAVRAEVSLDANRLGAVNRVVVAWPVTRFEYGHRYVALLTDRLTGPGGAPLTRAGGLDASASSAAGVRLAALRADAARLEPARDWSTYRSATAFVVRSQENVTGDLDRMAARVRAADHPIRNVHTGVSLVGGAAAVTGEVRVSDFRDEDGVIPPGGDGPMTDRWIDFLLVMPERPASPAGAPVVIYGHGLTVSKETMLTVAGINAAKGMATVGIDVPNHGSRQDEGGFLFDLANARKFGRLPSMALQGELDELSLLMAIQQHFGALDPMPWTWWTGRSGDGIPDLDTGRILYEGTSMGGFLGASFVALAPELDGAFLQVAGSGILDTLFHSILWVVFSSVEPQGAAPADVQALVGTVSMLLDRADNTNVLDRIRAAGTPVWLAYARDDGIVPNTSSNRMLDLLDLPVEGRTYVPTLPSVVHVDGMPADGSGATQIPTAYLDDNLAKSLLTHTSFLDAVPAEALRTWLDQRLAEAPPA